MKDKIKANVTIYVEYESPENGNVLTTRKIHLNGVIFNNVLPIQMQIEIAATSALKDITTKFTITEVRFVVVE